MFDLLDFTPGWDFSATIWAVSFGIVAARLEARRTYHRAAKVARCRRRPMRNARRFWLPARGASRHPGA